MAFHNGDEQRTPDQHAAPAPDELFDALDMLEAYAKANGRGDIIELVLELRHAIITGGDARQRGD